MTTEAVRLPGIFFEAPPPAPEEGLPRMDVAAFVGFAAAGPLDVPVAVESPRRFRDVFGDADPRLAWDDERGEWRHAHLGAAVEAFFANGGRRCWAVRVADRAAIAWHRFELPGLLAAEDRHTSPVRPVEARARAAGSWCEGLAVGTALSREPLPLVVGSSITFSLGAYRLDLAAGRTRVQAGDLLEVVLAPGAPVLLLFAERVLAAPGGVRVESGPVDPSTGETAGAFWIQPAVESPPASPPSPRPEDETVPPIPLAEADGLLAAASLGSPPTATVRRLSFELLVWQGTELRHRLGDLAFGSRHPRFWAALPSDDELFRLLPGSGAPEEPVGLAREAADPRFPLAGPEEQPAPFYLPWGMGRLRTHEAARALPPEATAGSTALDRDGLARFRAGLFVDERLARVGVGALLGEAEHRLHVAGRPLTGLHCLLPVEEVSLVALPDAVHRGWSRDLPPAPTPLGAPELDPIPEPDAAGRYPLTWTAVAGAESYTLERDGDPAFPLPVTVLEGESLGAPVALPAGCPREVFFRVRASREGEVGPWSNTRGARLPEEDFEPCAASRPGGLVLEFDAGSPGPALVWAPEDPAAALPGEWEVEAAPDAGFAAAEPFTPEGMIAGYAPLPERRTAARYYRVRAREDGTYGPWSNTVPIGPTERGAFTEPLPRDYDASVLLSVQRALLRFAAARGDFQAVLALPDHYRTSEALEHVGRLTPGGPEEEPSPLPSTLDPRVPPLTQGETFVPSFGALYHPWTVARVGRQVDGRPLRRLPPDGAMAGIMAALAAEEGAWRAPANRPLAAVVALEPELGPEAWPRLAPAGLNVLLPDPRGFLARSEDNLGGERALSRIHVRRLMILLRRLALREGERWAFEPHGPALRRRVRHLFERLLGVLFERGAFAGADPDAAFRVVTDESVNRPSTVERGRLVVELRVAPAAALAYLTVRLVTAGPGRLAVEEG